METTEQEIVTCLGKTFVNEEERREYFREELRKKLPDLKKMDGFPIGDDEDIIELSDPPYYTACPNPWINELIEEWEQVKEKEQNRDTDFKLEEPYSKDVSEGKYDSMFRYHPFPTKVPHKAIMRYIHYYTQPGDIILDAFAGTGMTGVAADMCADPKETKELDLNFDPKIGTRKTVLNDLSPSATFISRNYNCRVRDHKDFVEEANKIMAEIEEEIGWMYETDHNGKKGKINYTVWSDVFLCSNCSHEIIFWEDAVDYEEGNVKSTFNCPECNAELSKSDIERSFETKIDFAQNEPKRYAKQVPVLINYSVGTTRHEKKPTEKDLEKLKKIESFNVDGWFPSYRMMEGKETRRNDPIGLSHVHDFYSNRNLIALSKLREKTPDSIFYILITKVAYRITKLYALTYQSGTWGAGGGPTAGTMYVPSLIKELNITNQIRRAIKQRKKLRNKDSLGNTIQTTGSSTNLNELKKESVDYIFVDPPFGSNINYSELAFLWESWLKVFTNNTFEAIEDGASGKSLKDYRKLLQLCFDECFRVLKAGKWMTVIFSNTKAEVWNSINSAIQESGFIISNVSSLDKKKGSFKAITTPTAVKQDLVISCYKPGEDFKANFEKHSGEVAVWDFVDDHLNHLPIHLKHENSTLAIIERSPKILYDRLVSFYISRGRAVPMDSKEFQSELKRRYIERDGMYFTQDQASKYDAKKASAPQFVQLSLNIANENEGIEWLRAELKDNPQTYQDLHPKWMKAITAVRKGDILPELQTILEQNFIKREDDKLRVPNMNEAKDREAMRNKALLREFEEYVDQVTGQGAKKLKEARAEALRAGFKNCWDKKDFKTIVQVGEKIPENLLLEDDQLLMYYDIATDRV